MNALPYGIDTPPWLDESTREDPRRPGPSSLTRPPLCCHSASIEAAIVDAQGDPAPHRCHCSDFGLHLSHITTPGGRISSPPRYQAPGYRMGANLFRRDSPIPQNAAPSHQSALLSERMAPTSTATRIHPPGEIATSSPGRASEHRPRLGNQPPQTINPATATIFSRDQGSRDTRQRRNYSIITKLTLQRLTHPSHTNATTRQQQHTPPHPDNNLPR